MAGTGFQKTPTGCTQIIASGLWSGCSVGGSCGATRSSALVARRVSTLNVCNAETSLESAATPASLRRLHPNNSERSLRTPTPDARKTSKVSAIHDTGTSSRVKVPHWPITRKFGDRLLGLTERVRPLALPIRPQTQPRSEFQRGEIKGGPGFGP